MGRLLAKPRLRAALVGLGLLCAALALIAWPAQSAAAVREGLALCANVVVPSLFPFFVLASLVVELGLSRCLGRLLHPIMAPLFRVNGACAAALALGFVGGYPVGARTVAQLYRRGGISRREACRLLLFSNNCGPAFILGVAGLGCFGSLRAGVLLWGVHILAALVIALALPRQAAEPSERPGSVPARPPLVPALIAAVRDAAGTMVYICGFVVFFLVLLRVMGRVTGLSHPVLSGAVELTQGILALPHTRRGFVWAAGLLGWGGLSVHGQSAAVLSGTDLPMGPYLAAKAAHAAVSVLLAWPVSMCL